MPDNPIDIAKQDAIDDLQKRLDDVERETLNIIIESLEKNIGINVESKGFVEKLNKISFDILSTMQTSPKLTGAIGSFIKRLDNIFKAIQGFQKAQGITVPTFDKAKQTVINNVIDQMLNNGLNRGFVQPLRDLMYQNFISGISLTDAKKILKGYTGKISSYLIQTAQQGVDAYSGMINKKLLETFSYNGLLMTGSLIKTSSPQCRYVANELNRRITRENWPDVKEIAKDNGLIEGTTFDNLPLNLNHWGCRHGFYPIILNLS